MKAILFDFRNLDPFGFERFLTCLDVLYHEIEVVMWNALIFLRVGEQQQVRSAAQFQNCRSVIAIYRTQSQRVEKLSAFLHIVDAPCDMTDPYARPVVAASHRAIPSSVPCSDRR